MCSVKHFMFLLQAHSQISQEQDNGLKAQLGATAKNVTSQKSI
jgi:hypothetical protein